MTQSRYKTTPYQEWSDAKLQGRINMHERDLSCLVSYVAKRHHGKTRRLTESEARTVLILTEKIRDYKAELERRNA